MILESSTKKIIPFLDFHLNNPKKGMKPKNQDRFFLFTGLTGSGKSNTVLHFFHMWYNDILKEGATEDKFKDFFAGRLKGFANCLQNAKHQKYRMIVHDEVIHDLHAKDGNTRLAKKLYQVYNIIRGKNIFTCVLIPSLCDFSKDFVTERVQHIVHCYEEKGEYFAVYYAPKNTSKLIPMMFQMKERMKRGSGEQRPDPLECEVSYNIRWRVRQYKGVYSKMYEALKSDNMNDTIDDFASEVYDDEKKNPVRVEREKTIERMKKYIEKGMKYREIAEIEGKSYASIKVYCHENGITYRNNKPQINS
jgi:hypothetical protein